MTRVREYLDELGKNDSVLQKISKWFRFKYQRYVRDAWYDLKEGIKSFWRWRKVIWQDRTWGDNQIVDILIHKLEMDRKAFQKNYHGSDKRGQKIQDTMQQVITLLKRYNEDNYMEKYRELHDAKWGKDRHYFIKSEEHNDWYEWKSERDDNLTPEQLKQEQEEYRAYLEKSRYDERKDLNDAFLIMKKNLPYWWD